MNAQTKPPFRRLHNDPPVICLSAVQLVNERFTAGDTIPPPIWAKVPDKNKVALLSIGTLTTDPVDISQGELALHAERRTALDEASSTREVLARIVADMAVAKQEIEEFEKVHQASALADYRAGKPSLTPPALSAARDRLESLTKAEVQAIEEVERLDNLAETLARKAELERGRMIMEKRGTVCVEIQARIAALVPIFTQYRGLASQFRQLTHDVGQQVTSAWRLESLIDEQLLGRAVNRSLRVSDLAEIETRVFQSVLDRTLKELEKVNGTTRELEG